MQAQNDGGDLFRFVQDQAKRRAVSVCWAKSWQPLAPGGPVTPKRHRLGGRESTELLCTALKTGASSCRHDFPRGVQKVNPEAPTKTDGKIPSGFWGQTEVGRFRNPVLRVGHLLGRDRSAQAPSRSHQASPQPKIPCGESAEPCLLQARAPNRNPHRDSPRTGRKRRRRKARLNHF